MAEWHGSVRGRLCPVAAASGQQGPLEVGLYLLLSSPLLSSSLKAGPSFLPSHASHTTAAMNFELPSDLQAYSGKPDGSIHASIIPFQKSNDNVRFFDHSREPSRTQWDNGGLPTREWESLLGQAREMADGAGFYRFPLPRSYGGQGHPDTNLWMCAIRYHLASSPAYGGGVSLSNDLQNEHSVVGNFPDFLMLYHWGNRQQKADLIPLRLRGEFRMTFGLTEIHHGSDATHMDTTATPCTLSGGQSGYTITGNKKWRTGAHSATHMLIFARTSGETGSSVGITAFIVPRATPGITIQSFEYTLNMPTDHATVLLEDVQVPTSAILGPLDDGLAIAQTFTHENRIRQAASSCGAAKFCVDRAVAYARERVVFGKPWPPTRQSSGPWWSCPRRPRCCGS